MTFYGSWRIVPPPLQGIVLPDLYFDHRFVIAGSDASDGIYSLAPDQNPAPAPVEVSGAEWTITVERMSIPTIFSRPGQFVPPSWLPSQVIRSPSYTVQGCLIVSLDIDTAAAGKAGYYPVTVICQNLDQSLNPYCSFNNPYDFAVSEQVLEKYRDGGS